MSTIERPFPGLVLGSASGGPTLGLKYPGRKVAGLMLGPAPPPALLGLNVAASTQGASTPNQAIFNSGTNTFDLRVRATLANWANGFQCFIAQRQANADSRWELYGDSTGNLNVTYFAPGAVNNTFTCSASLTYANAATGWVRVLVDFTTPTGAFYTATDATGTAWSQLGASFTPAVTGLQVAGSPPLIKVGQDLFGNFVNGKIHRAQVYIASVLKIDMDFASATPGTGPWVATTGETWTRLGASTVS